MAAIEAGNRLQARDNDATPRRAQASQGTPGNEKSEEYAKVAAEGGLPEGAVPDAYR